MNPAIKEKWITALLSGDYKQGRNYLNNKGKFCCLGVLCDLFVKEHKEEWQVFNKDYPTTLNIDGGEALPRKRVLIWANKDSVNLPLDDLGTISTSEELALTKFNDNGSSFSEIAEIIKKHF